MGQPVVNLILRRDNPTFRTAIPNPFVDVAVYKGKQSKS